jgi:GT2 family glycosyltransferase
MSSSNPSSGNAPIPLPRSDYDVVGSIVLYNTDPREVEKAVGQFLAAPVRSHLCVLDNSPTTTWLPIYDDPRVSYHFCNGNLGYGRAHNIAIRAAAGRSRYSLVMNTDITYSRDTIPYLVAFMDRNLQAGMTAPKILYPDGTLQYVCRLLPHPGNLILRRFLPGISLTRRADARYELRWWKHDQVANIPYFQGSFMLMRTDRSIEVGGFDERFFLYGEDIDLTRRLHAISETLYIPDVHVIHEYRRYSKHSLRGTWYGIQNNCRYFNKWGWVFDRDRRRINSSVVAGLTTHVYPK